MGYYNNGNKDGGEFHAIVGFGVSGSGSNTYPDVAVPTPATWGNTYVHVMDPNNNGGAYAVYRGNQLLDHQQYPQWFKTLKTTTYVAPPVETLLVWVNGLPRIGSTVYVNRNYPFSVTASLAPNGFAGTQADWWIAAQYWGVLYYYVNGYWTTAAVPTPCTRPRSGLLT